MSIDLDVAAELPSDFEDEPFQIVSTSPPCTCDGTWEGGIYVHARSCEVRKTCPSAYGERMFDVSSPPVGRREKRTAAFNAEYAKRRQEKA